MIFTTAEYLVFALATTVTVILFVTERGSDRIKPGVDIFDVVTAFMYKMLLPQAAALDARIVAVMAIAFSCVILRKRWLQPARVIGVFVTLATFAALLVSCMHEVVR